MPLHVHIVPAFEDNYLFILEDTASKEIILVDPGDPAPLVAWFKANNKVPTAIWNTHHHKDHTGGNKVIKDIYNCPIYAPRNDAKRIKHYDHLIADNDTMMLGEYRFTVMDIAGHTMGHIGYYCAQEDLLFCGDTLFAMGCGRVFEGTYEQMFNSLLKIKNLPSKTTIYCAHEYTLSNGKFAITADPDNQDIAKRYKAVKEMRANNVGTVPTSLEIELKTNVFLRANSATEFERLRTAKDTF